MDATLAWARQLFSRYYRREPVYLPPRFGRREFGFLFLGEKGMRRHTAFTARQELATFLATRGPSHAYYSAAYYEQPDSQDMAGKGWLGADLIFDLDADHLEGAEGKSFPEILEMVREQAVKLVDEFLLGHFGFLERDLRIAFSGGRGYHIHVTHPDVHPLESRERREIVDYITGMGLNVERLIRPRVIESREVAGHASEKRRWELPGRDEPGWRGLFTRTLVYELRELAGTDPDEAREQLVQLKGIGEKKAQQLIDQLTPEAIGRIGAAGRVDHIPALSDKRVLEALAERTRVQAIGETDEPVTADTKRLIRLPGSLHGKSGLRVTPLTLDQLRTFDPLTDAVALGDDPVRVVADKPQRVGLKGVVHELGPADGPTELPEHVAAMLVLQRRARLAGPEDAAAGRDGSEAPAGEVAS